MKNETLKTMEIVSGVILLMCFILSRIQEASMKRHKDRFNSQEIEIFKDTKRFHMQCQRMNDKQKQYWQRKPYEFGGRNEKS